MPFIAALVGALVSAVGTFIGRAIVSLGIGFVVFKGFKVTLDWLQTHVIQAFSNLPPEIYSLAAYLKIGVCINIIFSAFAVRLIINGLQSDSVKKMIWK